MRILVYPHDLNLGGSQLVAVDLAVELARRGHEIVVYSRPGPLSERLGAHGFTMRLDRSASRRISFRTARDLRLIAREEQVDIIHAHGVNPCLEAFFGPHLLDAIPLVDSEYMATGLPFHPHVPSRIPLMVGTKSRAREVRRIRRGPVLIARPPVSVPVASPTAGDPRFAEALGIEPTALAIVVVSRLSLFPQYVRGVELVIDAVAALGGESVNLVVVGDGDARPRIEARAAAVNSALGRDAIRFAGELDDLEPAYRAAAIVVGMATSALRGMALGRPTIILGPTGTFRVCDERAIAGFVDAGLFAPQSAARDAAALADTLKSLLADERRRLELGRIAFEAARRYWGIEAVTDEVERCYRLALDAPGSLAARVADAIGVVLQLPRRNSGRSTWNRRPSADVKPARAASP
jgi:glycosyltransferase involved in cell wall biosynthesis